MNQTLAQKTLELRSGTSVPVVGLGVWQGFQPAAVGVTQKAVTAALQLGYRHIDTARIYNNEVEVGAAVRASGIPREHIFITTKLWNEDQGYDRALRAFDASLERLGVDYVDLYLLHWPVAGKRLDSWRALERLFADKRARAIGVSNFLVPHLEELLGKANVVPAVNQIELTPFLQRRETRALCRQHGIVVEGYSPLARGRRFDHPVLVAVARRVGRSPAQVLLRWGLEQGHVVLPKSNTPARIAENGALFDFTLDEQAMHELDGLEENLATGWNPAEQA